MKQFLKILSVIFLIQLPNWYFILGRESGGIDDFGNESWIIVSDCFSTIFSFPIYFFISDKIDNNGLAFVIYLVDLVLVSLILHLILMGISRLKQRPNNDTANKSSL